MADPDIVVRLRQGWLAHWDTDVRFVMVYASEWVRLTNLTTESADEIERLRQECTRLAQRNTVLVSEIDTAREVMLRQDNEMSNLRQRNSDLRDRNTRLLSQIQEMEAREQ